jgi:hypothetical protein
VSGCSDTSRHWGTTEGNTDWLARS